MSSLSCNFFITCFVLFIEEVLGPKQEEDLIKLLKENKFSLMVDESTDRNTDKQVVILTRVFCESQIVTKFVDMPTCNLGSAEDLFGVINKSFR